ncbi:MAG: glucose/mannose-6-phosphate isomerase [Parcubacteria bacterium C7867-004]|nr:MAG: glucose/mannose-6-phosphate isomerase [Parcubacteria bacterium C7867-004]
MIDSLDDQLGYVPEVVGTVSRPKVLVCGGMGGSFLPALALRFLGATPYVIAHRDYGLPSPVLEGATYVAISYSGETEETVSFAKEAIANGLPLSVIAGGGTLLALASEHNLPHVVIPQGPVPREALIVMVRALLALIGEEHLLPDSASFDQGGAEHEGEVLAGLLSERLPIFYSSGRNEALSYFAKIFSNETAKIPAFANVLPEFNHNELQGFGGIDSSRALRDPLYGVFLADATDHERVQKRMALTQRVLSGAGVPSVKIDLPSASRVETLLYGFWLIRTTAHALAKQYGVDPDETKLIDSFKTML